MLQQTLKIFEEKYIVLVSQWFSKKEMQTLCFTEGMHVQSVRYRLFYFLSVFFVLTVDKHFHFFGLVRVCQSVYEGHFNIIREF